MTFSIEAQCELGVNGAILAVPYYLALKAGFWCKFFKVALPDGTFRGGPAFYIERGLGSRRWGMVFALRSLNKMLPGSKNC